MFSHGKENSASRASVHILDHTARIRALNDQFRQTLVGGRVMVTSGIHELGVVSVTAILARVTAFEQQRVGLHHRLFVGSCRNQIQAVVGIRNPNKFCLSAINQVA